MRHGNGDVQEHVRRTPGGRPARGGRRSGHFRRIVAAAATAAGESACFASSAARRKRKPARGRASIAPTKDPSSGASATWRSRISTRSESGSGCCSTTDETLRFPSVAGEDPGACDLRPRWECQLGFRTGAVTGSVASADLATSSRSIRGGAVSEGGLGGFVTHEKRLGSLENLPSTPSTIAPVDELEPIRP